ncbi:MAG: DMT family transporter [Acidobacteriota bacterium]|nr:DMT family transporter [Acidobacteriota bacterium]
MTRSNAADEPAGQPAGLKPHVALVAVQIFFGTWPIVGKFVLQVVPSTGLVALRVAGGALAFLLLQRKAGRVRLERRSDYARVALYGLLGVVLNQLLYVKGLALSTAVNATLLGTMIPVFTLLVAVLLGREEFSARVAVGVVIAACGAIYLVNPAAADFSGAHTVGNLLLVANCIFYGAYIALSQDVIRRYGALRVITWVFLFACVVTVPLGAFNLSRAPLREAGAGVWLSILYIILVPTVGAYYFNAWALGRVAPSVVAIYVYLQPLIGLALAPYLLGEQLGARVWLAAALIFAGVGVVTIRRRSRAYEEVSERPDALGH